MKRTELPTHAQDSIEMEALSPTELDEVNLDSDGEDLPDETDIESARLLPQVSEDEVGDGVIIDIADDEALSEHTLSRWQVMKGLSHVIFAKENRLSISIAALLSGATTGFSFLSAYLLGVTIQLMLSDDENTDVAGVQLSQSSLITLMVLSYYLSQVIPNARDQIMAPVTANNAEKLLERSTEHLLKRSLNFHVNTSESDFAYIIQKSFALSTIGTPLLSQILPTTIQGIIAGVLLSTQYDAVMGSSVVGLLAAYVTYSAVTAKPIIKVNEEMVVKGNKVWQSFMGALGRYKPMRDFGKYDETVKELNKVFSEWQKVFKQSMARPLQIGLGHSTLAYAHMLMAALYVSSGVRSGKHSSQDFVTIMGYLLQLTNILPAFGQAVNQLVASYPDLKFMLTELAKPDDIVDLYPNVHLPVVAGRAPMIEFSGVTFKHAARPGQQNASVLFENLSFTVEPGQKVALVSASGAGKTTIFNLLCRYYDCTQGTIKINGQDISTVSRHSLQQTLGLFGQNPNLSKGSIRDNICYGAENSNKVTDEMIWALARQANLYDFLNAFPDKLDTDVGEDGKALSGGQQQKVAILRGLMKKSPIWLLDEVTASLDSQSATQVLEAIHGVSDGVTCLMITHKLTEAQHADQIIVIDKGKVLAQGTHDSLLETCTLYSELWAAYNQHNTVQSPRVTTSSSSFFAVASQATEVMSLRAHVVNSIDDDSTQDIVASFF